MTKSESDLLVRTAPGTPCGDLMRRYWQPVGLESELASDTPIAVTVLHEELVLFRDDRGRPGLLDRHCPHRGVDLSYGRCEDGGLRCLYHGWLFDVAGRCLEQPSEPAGSTFHKRVHQRSYPCREAGGLIFAYLGPGEPPTFPEFAGFGVPETHRWTGKIFHACNYLQANEGNLDQAHLSMLHRVPEAGKEGVAVAGSSKRHYELLMQDASPAIELERTPWGFREYVTRKAPEGEYLKVEAFILPNMAVFPGAPAGRDGFQCHWHVPIDDSSHWKFILAHRFSEPLNKPAITRALVGDDELDPNFHPRRNAANRYLQDRAAMKVFPGAGLGRALEIHDVWAVESSGPIQDRSKEQLGYSDKSVIMLRRCMQEAIKQLQTSGDVPPLAVDGADVATEIISIGDVVPAGTDGPKHLRTKIEALRKR